MSQICFALASLLLQSYLFRVRACLNHCADVVPLNGAGANTLRSLVFRVEVSAESSLDGARLVRQRAVVQGLMLFISKRAISGADS